MNESVDVFLRQALLSDLDVIVVNLSRGEHGFENSNTDPGVPALIEILINFLKRNLGAPNLAPDAR